MTVPLSLSSVPAVLPYIQYVATGGQTVYPYPFPITQDSDLVVVINGVTQATDSGYTLSGQGNATGGNVTLNVGSTVNDVVTLFRNISIARITQIGQNSGFASAAFNAEFNNIYLILQQLQESINLSLQIPNTNSPAPVTTLTAGYANKYLAFDASGNPTPAALTSSGSVTGALIAGLLNLITGTAPTADKVRTAQEIAAAVVPVNFAFPPGHLYRYGTNTTPGTTDMTAAVANWCAVGGNLAMPVPEAVLISAAISLVSNTTMTVVQGAVFQSATHDISFFVGNGKTNIRLIGLHCKQTSAGNAATVGGVQFTNCTHCSVEDGEFEGMQWAGIYLDSSSYCLVSGNYCHDFLNSTAGDKTDIVVYRNSSYNVVTNNRCYGGAFVNHGVLCQDPGGVGTYLPQHNIISENLIDAHTGYGVAVYIGSLTGSAGGTDSYNQVLNNNIQNITGAYPGGAGGCGVYVVGYGAGGTEVIGNSIRNCCTGTSVRSLAPGHIGVSGLAAVGAPVIIANNSISDVSRYDGILCNSSLGVPVIVSNNGVRMPSGNSTGDPIRADNVVNLSILGNNISRANDQGRCIMAYANTAGVISNLVIEGNICAGGAGHQIDFVTAGGGTFAQVTVNGNVISGGGTGATPLNLLSIAQGSVSNNVCNGTNTFAAVFTSCTNVRLVSNAFATSGTIGFTASGTCTGSYFDKSNSPGGFIQNTATGLICEQLLSAAPVSASSAGAVGDRVEQSVPVVGNPKGWRCTVAASPGTWVSEGNL